MTSSPPDATRVFTVHDAHQVPAAAMMSLTRGHNSWVQVGADVRREFARFVDSSREPLRGWPQAWNAFVAAHRGRLTIPQMRCPTCHGRRFDVRRPHVNMSRTGSPYVCGDCHGTGHVRDHVTLTPILDPTGTGD